MKMLGSIDEKMFLIDTSSVEYFYAVGRKVFAVSENNQYHIKARLYEVEDKYCGDDFVRLSKSVIANLNKIESLKRAQNGTIEISFVCGDKQFTSRAQSKILRQKLAIN